MPSDDKPLSRPDVEDEGVFETPLTLDFVDHPTDVMVGVFREAGENLHEAALERLLRIRESIPTTPSSRDAA
jgi:hypothetical protein